MNFSTLELHASPDQHFTLLPNWSSAPLRLVDEIPNAASCVEVAPLPASDRMALLRARADARRQHYGSEINTGPSDDNAGIGVLQFDTEAWQG